jgi:protein-S-isoprenylcysteine O-methyltransferase Ste14
MDHLLERQGLHVVLLAGLLLLIGGLAAVVPDMLAGELWGLATPVWLILAIIDPIVHQILVVLFWRAELHGGLISRRLGREHGFRLYKLLFTVFFAGRLMTIVLVGVSNYGSLNLPPALAYGLALVLLVPAVYLFYSVARYFGMDRAYGIDHFDPAYRGKPLVKQGIFRFTSNGMYTFGLLVLWIPGLVLFSQAALLAALFNHLYIWVHYYCTELPDMRRIYEAATD